MPDPQSKHRLECAIATETGEPGLWNRRKKAPGDERTAQIAVEISFKPG
jgi:hypothetical protein